MTGRIPLAGAVLALALAAGLAVAVLGDPHPAAAQPQALPPYATAWTCPVVPGGPASVHVVNLAADPMRLSIGTAATGSSSTDPPRLGPTDLAPRAVSAVRVPEGLGGAVSATAVGGGAAVLADGSPACARAPGDHWWLPYADTRNGADTVIALADPGAADAFVDLVLHTAAGPVSPKQLTAIRVETGRSRQVSLRGVAPDLTSAVEVIARSGAVVAGARVVRAPENRKLGSVVVSAQPVGGSSWAFAGGRTAGGATTDIVLGNPGQEPLGVDFELTTTDGTFTPTGFGSLEVPPGGILQVPISARIQGSGVFGVLVASRDHRALAAALLVHTAPAPTAPGQDVVDAGVSAADTRWVLRSPGRLVLFNPGPRQADVRIESIDGSGWTEATVPAGTVALTTAPAGVLSATSAGPIVAAPFDGSSAIAEREIVGARLSGPVQPGPVARP